MASQQAKAQQVHTSIWTPANIVTVARICGVPVFVIALLGAWPSWFPQFLNLEPTQPWVATLFFVILAATDGLDGYLARSRGEVTNFGKFVDPLADKILTTSAFLVLVELHVLPAWAVIIILTREFIVAGIRMVAATQNVVIAASWYGKAKTFTQIIAIVLFIIKDSTLVASISHQACIALNVLAWLVMIAALVFTIISMVDYFDKAKDLLNLRPQGKKKAGVQTADTSGVLLACDSSVPSEAPIDTELVSNINLRHLSEDDLAQAASALSERLVFQAMNKSVGISVAESLTGGALSSALTSVVGASAVFRGGIVSYAPEAKVSELAVEQKLVDEHRIVSADMVEQMALGARKRFDAQLSVALSGVAGPGPDAQGNPAGLVYIGFATSEETGAQRFNFEGDRSRVRLCSVVAALRILNQKIDEL